MVPIDEVAGREVEVIQMPKQPRPAARMWQLRPWNSNPLMRGSDRCETLVRMLAALAVLVAVPLAGAAGTASY
ncbi:hypothetical protein ACFWFG_38600, partial [Streptomyces roseolus]